MTRAGLLLAALATAACNDVNNHLLYGQEYDVQGKCLRPTVVVDDLSGPDPGQSCAPECIASTNPGASGVFVTTTCPPIPAQYAPETPETARGTSDPCTAAFSAYAAGALCGGDAGADADAGVEAGPDAPGG